MSGIVHYEASESDHPLVEVTHAASFSTPRDILAFSHLTSIVPLYSSWIISAD